MERRDLDREAQELLERAFGPGGSVVVGSAPGRVNLIGEHTDYNEGFVFPMAIEARVHVAGRRRDDRLVRVTSADFDGRVEFSLAEPARFDEDARWSNYPRGVVWALQEAGHALPGMDLAVVGDVPLGAGLSSSAALEVATAVVAARLAGLDLAGAALATLCQRAENEFVGTRCGIMDQFVAAAARAGHALFLDCRSLEPLHVPLALGEHRLVVVHTGVNHSLVESEYNLRREQCEAAVDVLGDRFLEVTALRDVTLGRLDVCRDELDPTVLKRCRHVVTENNRARQSVQALRRGELAELGRLMNASHDSLRDDYEVSCPELDLLVELARAVPGVLGARMTGGGFGGCTVNLVAADALERFRAEVLGPYEQRTGLAPRSWVSVAAPGATVSGGDA